MKCIHMKKVFYKNTDSELTELQLPRCPKPCRYSDFKRAMKNKALWNREEHCQLDGSGNDGNTELDQLSGSDKMLPFQQYSSMIFALLTFFM